MITEQDLAQAIAECQGERSPNANTCIKLAAFLTIKQALFGDKPETYSFAPALSPQVENSVVVYDSDTEFGHAVSGMDQKAVFSVIDELMSTLKIVNRRLYDAVLRRL